MPETGASTRIEVFGHSQIGLTMNTYAHVMPEIERAAVAGRRSWLYEWLHGQAL